MSCPTCDHTMLRFGSMVKPYEDVPLFWCSRCGTIKANIVMTEHSVPSLVKRCIRFGEKLTDEHQELIDWFEIIGIRESIMVDEGMI